MVSKLRPVFSHELHVCVKCHKLKGHAPSNNMHITFSSSSQLNQEYDLVRVFDSMKFEDETTDRMEIGIEGHGNLDAQQSREVMHLCDISKAGVSFLHVLQCRSKDMHESSVKHVRLLFPRQIAMGNHMQQFNSNVPVILPGDGTRSVEGTLPPPPPPNKKRVVPLTKQLQSKISASSAKLTECMAWESKITDCTTLLLS